MSHAERLNMHFKALNAIQLPRVMRAVSLLVSSGLALTIAFLVFTPWVQTTTGPGVVTALDPGDRMQDLTALVPGRIERWHVQDGSRVRAGDPIVQLADNDPQLVERLQAERDQVSAKLRSAEAALRTAEIDLRRQQGLFDEGLAARRDLELAQIKVSEFEGRVAEAAAERNRVDIGLSRQSAQLVTAPRDGMILSIQAGDTSTLVGAGDVLATFVPDGAELAVELFVQGRDVPLVFTGRKVRLQFEGWPAVQFSGWPSVAIGTFGGQVLSVDPTASANGLFRVLVTPDPEAAPWPDPRFIRMGAKAQGWVLLETVSVGFEVWRQLNSFPPAAPRTPTPESVQDQV